jgi:DNA repair protein RadC
MVYLKAALSRKRIEHFRFISVDTRNQLIADGEHGSGAVKHNPVYPRGVAAP